ncbi:MAG: endonuclease/exonuclease/phosphatase family protein [Clostridia bacterium]|nr:endonuclease/exonuclease/phosphatase family protein [Clostridia bacterium]
MILKCITLNMCHGEGLDGKIDVRRQAMFLRKYKPDIIFLQEIDMYTKRAYNKNQLYTLSKYTGLNFRAMGTNIKYKKGFYGDGILSKFPIEYSANYLSPLTNPSHEQRGILCNKISFGNTKINIFSIHMSTHEDERILTAKELIRITSKINKGESIIIGGDFNVGVSKIGNHKYNYHPKDIYEEYEILKGKFKSIENTEITWNSKEGSGCIDSFFYSKNLHLIKQQTIKTDISDHYPVYAEFLI